MPAEVRLSSGLRRNSPRVEDSTVLPDGSRLDGRRSRRSADGEWSGDVISSKSFG